MSMADVLFNMVVKKQHLNYVHSDVSFNQHNYIWFLIGKHVTTDTRNEVLECVKDSVGNIIDRLHIISLSYDDNQQRFAESAD